MGWSAGSGLGQDIYGMVRDYIPEDKREEVAKFIYESVCDLDADDWDGTSQLEIDGKVEAYCYGCDEDTTADKLEDGYCANCVKEGKNG